MRILSMEPAAEQRGGTRTLATFDLELSPQVRLYGLRLVDHAGRRLTYAPCANGGRRVATFAPALAEQITEAALAHYERQKTADEAYRH